MFGSILRGIGRAHKGDIMGEDVGLSVFLHLIVDRGYAIRTA